MSDPAPDDILDAGCEEDTPRREDTPDEDIDALVLFASIDFTDREAVEEHAEKWRTLFPHGRED